VIKPGTTVCRHHPQEPRHGGWLQSCSLAAVSHRSRESEVAITGSLGRGGDGRHWA
jgi:hypothetical protein